MTSSARAIEPRYAWAPKTDRGFGREACEFWRAAGGTLFDWQEESIERMLRIGDDDLWATTDDGLCVARQNGKGVDLQVIELFVAFEFGHSLGYDVVMHTAHEVPTALEHQLRLEEVIQNAPHLHSKVKDIGGYRHANGQESIRLKDGTRVIFKARTRGGARGYSGDLLVWDEAMEIPDHVVGAQKPTTRASTATYGQKTIYAGSAVDQTVHLHGRQFALIRKRGIEESKRVSWTEFSAPFDHPDEVSAEEFADRANWYAANPSLGILIREETMADEVETMPRRVALVELFGVGDWPDPDDAGDRVVDLDVWDSLVRDDSRLEPPYVLTFDVSPDRWTAISLAGRNQRERYHVEIQEFRQGTGWAPAWIADAWNRKGDEIYSVACDGVGPAASLVPELESLGVPVDTVTTSDHAEACGNFVNLVAERGVEHLGSSELRDAIAGAAARNVGDRWLWTRRNSRANIAPLVAGTLGLGIAAGISVGEVMIY